MPVREGAHEVGHVALVGAQAAAHARGDPVEVEVDAECRDLLCLHEVVQELAAAASEVEDARLRLDPFADHRMSTVRFYDARASMGQIAKSKA